MARNDVLGVLRETVNLHNLVIKTELINRKLGYTKIFTQDKVVVSLGAISWQKNNYKSYRKYCSTIVLSNEEFSKLSNKDIGKLLLCGIYNQVIKNNIMML